MTVSREGAQSRETSLPAALIIPLGLAIGFFAALAGMGGAVFSIMILVGFFHVPMRMVAGVCTFVQVCGAAFGCVGYALGGVGEAQVVPLSVGYVNLPAAVAIAAVGVPLAMVGARLAQRARPAAARKVLAGLLVLLAAQMLKVW